MADKRTRFQCMWSGKLYESKEEALADCDAPIQPVIQRVDSHWRKGLLGTVSKKSKKK